MKKEKSLFEFDAKRESAIRHKDHRLTSRRDFLAQGFIGAAAVTAMPSVLGLGIKSAMAAECGADNVSDMVPMMIFDMAGGAALPGNFLVYKENQQMLRSYNVLGWDPKASGALNEEFGLPMAANASGLLAGILATTNAEARARTRFGSIAHFSRDDTSSNQLNAGTLALNAGARGTYITNGLGVQKSNSGGRSRSILEDVTLKPTFVASVNDVLGATSFGGSGLTELQPRHLKALAKGTQSIADYQKSLFMKMPGGDVLGDLAECAYAKSVEFVEGVTGLDPREDQQARNVYGINQNTDPSNMNVVTASLSMNTLKGHSGPCTFTVGGCDYHGRNAQQTDAKDREMGEQIGRAIQLAHDMQKPFFFQLLTDGGCSAQNGERRWRSDAGDKSLTVMGFYNPSGAPKYYKDRMQVGHYTDGQGAERSTLVGAEPRMVGYAVFANYLNVCGKLDQWSTLAPGVFTKPEDLQSVLVFDNPKEA